MKTFQLLATLSREELKLLRKAVKSPLYNTNPKVVRLFEVLRPMHPDFDDSLKAKQKLFKKLFPKAAYNDYKLRWHFTELTKVIEQLLLYLEQESNDFERQKKLATIYNNRNLYPYFKKKVNGLLEQLSQEAIQSPENSWKQLSLLEMKYFHPLHDKYDLADSTLKVANEQLDIYFALKKYRLAVTLKSREQVLQEKYSNNLFDVLGKEIEKGFLKPHILLNLFQKAIELVSSESGKEFEEFEHIFFSNYTRFSLKDQQFLFFTGINFLIKETNKPDSIIKNKMLEWYKFGLDKKIILVSNKITENHFANIIITGCRENQADWVKGFMNTYQHYLPISNLKLTMLYYRGIFYYLQKDYDKALEILMNSGKKSVYPPRLRTILVRILFEQFLLDDSYYHPLLANLTAYEYYLKRNKLVAVNKLKEHQNFIKVLRYFAKKVFTLAKKETIQNWFNSFVENGNPILAKSWLELKLLEL